MSCHDETASAQCPHCNARLTVKVFASLEIDDVSVTSVAKGNKSGVAARRSAVVEALCAVDDAIDDLEGHTIEAKAATAAVELLRSLLASKTTRMETIAAASNAAQRIAEAAA